MLVFMGSGASPAVTEAQGSSLGSYYPAKTDNYDVQNCQMQATGQGTIRRQVNTYKLSKHQLNSTIYLHIPKRTSAYDTSGSSVEEPCDRGQSAITKDTVIERVIEKNGRKSRVIGQYISQIGRGREKVRDGLLQKTVSFKLLKHIAATEINSNHVQMETVIKSHALQNYPNDQYVDGQCTDTVCQNYPEKLNDKYSKKFRSKISKVLR
jgi:hypothetical protein